MGNGKFEGYLLVADFDDTFCPEHGAPVPEENRRAAQYFMDEDGLFTIAMGGTCARIIPYGINSPSTRRSFSVTAR